MTGAVKEQRVPAKKTSSWMLIAVDVIAWTLAILAALALRFDFNLNLIQFNWAFVLIAATIGLQFIAGWVTWLYRKRFAVGSFDEAKALVICVTLAVLPTLLFTIYVTKGQAIPRSTMFIAAPLAFVAMGLGRYILRLREEHQLRPGKEAPRTLIYGAGYAGSTTVRRLLTDPVAAYLPVGFLDDSPSQRNREVRGVRVLGGLKDLEQVSERTGATHLIVCIGDADSALLRRVNDKAAAIGMKVSVMPPLEQIFSGKHALSDIREISIEDLIGRYPVRLNQDSIATYIDGKRVLVTGAGGSIGSELCRQLTEFGPKELILLDRDETALQQTQISIRGNGLLSTREVVLADIRDEETLIRIFEDRRPQVVFHAAALKHLPMLEQYPDEAWKTNVIGTLNVLTAAQKVDVETFINISTDKAANPTSVLGHSKRVAEKLTAWMAEETGHRYLSVRFGNVIGSRGSMLPTFRKLIKAGGPITITHPEVTRFFMTIPEACQLVMQAGAHGRPGEVLILDMGEPVKIIDIARRMIAESGQDIKIIYTGLRPGEKLHEDLIGSNEQDDRPFHPKISHARVDTLSRDRLSRDGWFARLSERESDVSLGAGDARITPITTSIPVIDS
ncbi:polysaccharide biosynthesis protein [Canibacter zhoujuaniae]|uniref:polysaccharide biosynthesis protein n=1 Tax=Canibacter zhoujuaniae TaxID=2708343 RepID=UPI001FB8DC22|nr:nucleoside-diphosphate sugar epimerase/dehydratase [Canibacter zhoujuaniae]